MKDRKLAVRYARALLSSIPAEAAEATEKFLGGLGQAMLGEDELREALVDPAVPRSRRLDMLQSMAREFGLPAEMERFLATIVEHGRIGVLPVIGEVFRELREEREGIVPVSMTTSTALSPELQDRARKALEGMTGKKVRLSCEVEPELIGGAVTRIGSKQYDGSLRTQLSLLRRRMIEE